MQANTNISCRTTVDRRGLRLAGAGTPQAAATDFRQYAAMRMTLTLLLLAMAFVSVFYASMTNADTNSDRLAQAASDFTNNVRVLGEKDGALAERAGVLRAHTKTLSKQGQDNFGSDDYRQTFALVKSLVNEIGRMEIQATPPITESWRAIHTNVSAIEQALGGNANANTGSNQANQTSKPDAKLGGVVGTVSSIKNSPEAGKHIDQVEDLAERVKNGFRDMLSRRPNMKSKPWSGRVDGILSELDQNANKARDAIKSGANWRPFVTAMKRQAMRVDRNIASRNIDDELRGQWKALKNHLEQI